MVQNRPAKESAIRAPMSGVKPAVPPKLARVFEACTIGMFSCWVRYVIIFAWNPVVANLSHTSFAAHQRNRFDKLDNFYESRIIYQIAAFNHVILIINSHDL